VALIAVTAKSNRSKGDQDPAQWMPPAQAAHCRYLTEWVTVKSRWELAVDRAEQEALVKEAASCLNVPVRVVRTG
jgi:hypothetical protein